jgi:hypothetical protein
MNQVSYGYDIGTQDEPACCIGIKEPSGLIRVIASCVGDDARAIEAWLAEREAQVRAETLRDDKDLTLAYMKGFSDGKAEEREKVAGLVKAALDCSYALQVARSPRTQKGKQDLDDIRRDLDGALATYNDNRKG